MRRFKDPYARGERVSPVFDAETLTNQNFAQECDINFIISRYDSDGLLTHVNDISNANYDDFTDVDDYKSALDRVFEAEESFSQLPPKIREEFDNSVEHFLVALSNPDMKSRLVEIGVFEPEPVVQSPESENPPKVDDANCPS